MQPVRPVRRRIDDLGQLRSDDPLRGTGLRGCRPARYRPAPCRESPATEPVREALRDVRSRRHASPHRQTDAGSARTSLSNGRSARLAVTRYRDRCLGFGDSDTASNAIPGRARGATPPCVLGSSESRQRRGVERARRAAPPCVLGLPGNRRRRGVGSPFLRPLDPDVITRPQQAGRSGSGHCS